ncbi:MAG: YggS family pyridoxal phosphate-dependent enzyme [Endomicrobia bacterium]|nr:YggS family pyridoxal phosphate-dependent enzyme [Endomicrobiia bacterium]MCL2798787.1 YggS family pyridoxal phosphate-dependent enzyme [Endomicrobiia bacterium]
MKDICGNINSIKDIINSIKNASTGKSSEIFPVEIIVVTKTFPYTEVLEALKCGIKHIGESRIQEALPKFEQLGANLNGITKHFIGHLQSNKAKKAVENFDLIHSLDSLDLAKDISRHAKNINKVQNCLIEIKVSSEASKNGVAPEKAAEFYCECLKIPNILIKGLMTITPIVENPEDARVYFNQVYSLFCDLKKDNQDFNILSMGMSGDYKIAVEEGANMVRIGSAVFGDRYYGNK